MNVRLRFLSGPFESQSLDVAETVVLGRQPAFGIAVPDPVVSSEHCRIVFRDEGVFLEDIGSTNGTELNGSPLSAPAALASGSRIQIGDTRIAVEFSETEPAPAAVPIIPQPSNINLQTSSPAPPPTKIKQPGASPGPSSASPPPVSLEGRPSVSAQGLRRDKPCRPPSKVAQASCLPSKPSQPSPALSAIPLSPSDMSDLSDKSDPPDKNSAPSASAPPQPALRRSNFNLHPSAFILSFLALILAALLLRGCGEGAPAARNMLDPAAQAAALRQFQREGVALTIREPAGLDRHAEPVTSGVPLPEGAVPDSTRLVLVNADGQPVPCQAVVQSRWPDGSAKWALLDFQATIASNAVARYTLSANGPHAAPESDHPVTIVQETDTALVLDNGRLNLTFDKTRPGLIHAITLDGEPLVNSDRPVGTTLVNEDNVIYYASKPDRFEIEHRGPMRTVVRIGGHYVAEDGQTIHDGKVGYDLRVSVYAGQPWLGLDFTLRNDGWYGYRNESQRRRRRPRQWLHMRSLSLDIPVVAGSESVMEADLSGRQLTLAAGDTANMVQWYLSPPYNARNQLGISTEFGKTNLAPHALAADMAQRYRGFYGAWTMNGKLTGERGRMKGEAVLTRQGKPDLRLAARRFWQNHPRGFAVTRNDAGHAATFSFLAFPEGGRWPETLEAFRAGTYQFEGGRRKTASLRLDAGGGADAHARRMDAPLLAFAPASWYRDTGAVFPLAESGQTPRIPDDRLAEAFERYDRTQRAKVVLEAGDPAGPHGPFKRIRYEKVSIPYLWERHPEVFTGWMNYGDLVWNFGYSSLHYDWPYSMLIHGLRLGDREFLDVAEDMARHRHDIDQYHVEDTATWLGGFQRFEKGEHGHLKRQRRHRQWEINAGPSHTWNRGLLLHWALTGDPRSLDAAEQNGRAYRRFFYNQHKLHEKETLPWRQIRVPGWAIENWLALHEYTGKTEYLDWANEIFDKSLLAMEQENGGVGHILPEGRQDAQQVAYTLEPVIRLHHHTGRDDIVGFLQRVLDWHREAGTARGFEKDGVYWPLLWREQWTGNDLTLEETPTHEWSQTFGWLFADGYAYLHRVLGRDKDMDIARRAFADTALHFGMQQVADPASRHALGYHWGGSPFGYTTKIQGLNGRYGLLYLYMDAGEGEKQR